MTNFWRGLAQEITQSDAVLDATEALAPKSLEAVDAPVDVAIYTHVYNVHGDYMDSIEGGEGLKASEIHFLPFTQPRDILGVDMRVFVGLLHKHSFQRFMADRGLEFLVSDSLLYNQWLNSVDSNLSDYLLSEGATDLSPEEMAAVNQLEIQDYYTLSDFYNGARIRNGKGTSLAAQIRACSAFYVGKKTVSALNTFYKGYEGVKSDEEIEYGGITYVSVDGELLLEECKGCPSGTESSLSGANLSNNYLDALSDGLYVASWQTHVPSAGPYPWTPSGVKGYTNPFGDVQSFEAVDSAIKSPAGKVFIKSNDESLLPAFFDDVSDDDIHKTHRISGGFGIIRSKNHITIFRHTGPRLRRLDEGRYVQYGYVTKKAMNIIYTAYHLRTLRIYEKF